MRSGVRHAPILVEQFMVGERELLEFSIFLSFVQQSRNYLNNQFENEYDSCCKIKTLYQLEWLLTEWNFAYIKQIK